MTCKLAERNSMLDAVWTACVLCLVTLPAHANEEYKTAQDAFNAGAKHLRAKENEPAQKALEAALALAPDDEYRLRVYDALTIVYRQLPEIDKMLEAGDFVIRHANQPAKRSLMASSLVSFLYQRGKIDVAIKRYEKRFQENPDDIAAVSILAQIFSRVERDAERGKAYTEKLALLDIAAARKFAEQCEKDAENAPRTAASLWKDAAIAWLEARENEKALAAAKQSIELGPESRSELLTYYWHEGLGTVFLKAGEPKQAIEQLEAARAITKIEGYQKNCDTKLAEARAALEKM